MSLQPIAQRIAAINHLCLAVGKDLRKIGEGQKREGLIVEIEGRVDEFAVGIGQRTVKATRLQVDPVEIGDAIAGHRLPIARPATPPGLGKAIDLTRLDP